jgi:hypothetical protein
MSSATLEASPGSAPWFACVWFEVVDESFETIASEPAPLGLTLLVREVVFRTSTMAVTATLTPLM